MGWGGVGWGRVGELGGGSEVELSRSSGDTVILTFAMFYFLCLVV